MWCRALRSVRTAVVRTRHRPTPLRRPCSEPWPGPMIQSVFILNDKGDVFVEKHYRGTLSRAVCDEFWKFVLKAPSPNEVLPIIATSKYYLVHVQRAGLFFLAVVHGETPPMLVLEFLGNVADVFRDYFTRLSEEKLREHYLVVCQLLDEMMDNGFPFNTEPAVLKDLIRPPSFFDPVAQVFMEQQEVRLSEGALSAIPWRKFGITHTNNELLMDIIESIDCIIDSNGQVITQEIQGEIQATCRLSGMPDLTLAFTNPSVIDDVSFHPCVRYVRWEQKRDISFIPPDGAFQLVRYRSSKPVDLPLYVKPQFSWHDSGGRVMVMVGHRLSAAKHDVEDVVVVIPFPKAVSTVTFSVNSGSVAYDMTSRVCRWTLGTLPRSITPQLNGNITLAPSESKPESNPTLSVEFKVNSMTMSGLEVKSLTLENERYKPYKGLRKIVKSGNIQIRA